MKTLPYVLSAIASLLIPVVSYAEWRHERPCQEAHASRFESTRGSAYHGYGSAYRGFGFAPKRISHDTFSEDAFRHGIRSGELSNREVHELHEREQEIHREKMAYWSDGELSKRERKDLEKDTRRFKDQLNHELHDRERRW